MKYYTFGKPTGRYIGSSGDLQVYSDSIYRGQAFTISSAARRFPEDISFRYGPSTGGMIEAMGVDFLTPGELIKDVHLEPEHKLRHLQILGRPVEDAILVVERINAFHAAANSIAFASAVEDAVGIEITKGVMLSRILGLELERIRSHLYVIERLCQAAGFGVPAHQLSYLRERMSRVISAACGHRYFFNSVRYGNSHIEKDKVVPEVRGVAAEFERIYRDLMESRLFINRLINNGRISYDKLVGPAARASGHAYDARADSQVLDYSGMSFTPVVRSNADALARMQVRAEEILQSADIIEEAAKRAVVAHPETECRGSGEGAARVESPQGDLFYFVKVEDSKISGIAMVSPSKSNMWAFSESMKGNVFTDFHFNWESFGIWICEAG
ncbi:MAG: hypothetical protein QXP70_06205, partial [Methanomassiliicoccales archaeon]